MKTKTSTLLNILLAILAIAFILIAVTESIYLLILPGVLCFLALFILRSQEIKRMNADLDAMNSDQFLDPEEDPDDRS